MFDHALPLWAERGWDHVHGGPVEELALDGGLSDPGFKRVRVFCRQVYVFSHAYLMGWQPGITHARKMYEAMVAHCWQGPDLGWAKRVTSDNQILDPTTDLYDNAFALFSLGWFYRVSPTREVLELMHQTVTLIDTKMRHPKLGFWHQIPVKGPRLQNPHMHTLEACLACLESTQDPIFERLAREIIALFQSHFYDPTRGTLCEYFDDNLDRLTEEKGHWVEPGHQFEWAWILASAHKLLGVEVTAQVQGLIAFGEEKGVDRANAATYNVILDDGRFVDAGSRTWPNTERLKAAVALFELTGADPLPVLRATLELLLNRYLAVEPLGGWLDAFDQAGKATAKAMPTSTFYHLFLAFAEVLRVADRLKAQ
jgi:N-acylglucosamine 2-epimerase/mannose-6-phosphate isomerase